MRRRIAVIAILGIAWNMGVAAGATDSSETRVDNRFGVYWRGLHVADAALTVTPQDGDVRSELSFFTRGLAYAFTKFQGKLSSVSSANPALSPTDFTARYKSSRYTRDVTMRYASDGRLTELDLRKRGEPQTSDVPAAMRDDTVDPLTAILRWRQWLREPGTKVGAKRRQNLFDGGSRYDVTATLAARKAGQITLKLTLEPIVGVSERSWMNGYGDTSGRWIEATLRDDANLAIESIRPGGPPDGSGIKLDKDCSGNPACAPLTD